MEFVCAQAGYNKMNLFKNKFNIKSTLVQE